MSHGAGCVIPSSKGKCSLSVLPWASQFLCLCVLTYIVGLIILTYLRVKCESQGGKALCMCPVVLVCVSRYTELYGIYKAIHLLLTLHL